MSGQPDRVDLQRRSSAYWRSAVNTYLAAPEYYARAEQVLADMLQRLGYVDAAVDFGCGDGRYTLLIASHAGQVLGLDLSPDLVATARRAAECRGLSAKVTFEVSAIETYDPQENYGLVSCLGVTSALIDSLVFDSALAHLAKAASQGGWLLMKDTLSGQHEEISEVGDYVAIYRARGQYLKALAAHGFDLVDEVELLALPTTTNSLLRFRKRR